MKFFKLILMTSLIFTLSQCGNKENNSQKPKDKIKAMAGELNTANAPAAKKYTFKSGIIHFEKDGLAGKSKTIIFFDDFGTKERNETYNSKGNLEEIRFSDGKNMYVINFKYGEAKTAFIMGPGIYGTEMKFVAEPFNKESDKQKFGYKRLEDMNIAGKECQAYRMKSPGTDVLFAGWNNILLYSETNTPLGTIRIKATDIKENAKVDPALFKVPEGYEVKKM